MHKTILLLAASPVDQAKLRLDVEAREIEEGLRRSQHRDQFQLQKQGAVRTDDLRRALLDTQPQILHFCGHGTGEDGLVFEDQQGKTQLISTDALANLFELFADQIECVVLNACYSEVQAKAIVQHVGYVIGMTKAIGDKAAIGFSIGFYDALGGGRSVEDAYRFGCNSIQLAGITEHLTPVLKKSPKLSASAKNSSLKSSQLTSWQLRYLEQEREGLKNQYDLLHEKLRRLRNTLIIETDEAVRFKLEKQIEREQPEWERIAQQLEIINNKLY